MRSVVPTPTDVRYNKFPLLSWYHGGGTDLPSECRYIISELHWLLQDQRLLRYCQMSILTIQMRNIAELTRSYFPLCRLLQRLISFPRIFRRSSSPDANLLAGIYHCQSTRCSAICWPSNHSKILLLFIFSFIYAYGYRSELLSMEKNEDEVLLGSVRFSC